MQRKLIVRLFISGLFIPAVWLPLAAAPVMAQNVEFKGVVKLIESHYRVKHKGVPLLARMGIKATQMVVQRAVRYSEYGSVKFAIFEDQDFSAAGSQIDFAARMRGALEPEWQPLVQVRLQQDADQTYIYMKESSNSRWLTHKGRCLYDKQTKAFDRYFYRSVANLPLL